jgi:hypothetical protein
MANHKNPANNNGEPVDVFLFIFKHDAAVFDFAPSMKDKVYKFNYSLYEETRGGWEDTDTMSGLFIDNFDRAAELGKGIMILNYSTHFADITKAVIEALNKEDPGHVFCLSFFHDDEITGSLRRKTRVFNMLNHKFSTIESMLDYPFIKKFEIPYNFDISEEYLTDILNELYF